MTATAQSPLDPAVTAHVDEVVQRSKSSFYWAMRLLPAQKRAGMYAIYAYCRVLDDIADGQADSDEKRRQLGMWRQEVNGVFDGRPTTNIGRALDHIRQSFPIDRADLLAVIDGVETDAAGPVVRPSMADLELYCDRVAGAVGKLSVAIFGATGSSGLTLAHSLGRALQFTNILRDVTEDCDEGRLYLPDEILSSAGIVGQTPEAVVADPNLDQACRRMADLAHGYFDQSGHALRLCERRSVKPAAVMMVSYRRLLQRMEQRGWPNSGPKVRLSRAEKLAIGIVHGLL